MTLLKVIGSKKILTENAEEYRDERSLDSDNLGEEDASIKRSDLPSIRSSNSSGHIDYITFNSNNVSNSLTSHSSGTIQSNVTLHSNSASNSNSGSGSNSSSKSAFNIRVRKVEKNYESFPENIGEEDDRSPSPENNRKNWLRPPENPATGYNERGILYIFAFLKWILSVFFISPGKGLNTIL